MIYPSTKSTTVKIESDMMPKYEEFVIMHNHIESMPENKGSFKMAFHFGQFEIEELLTVSFTRNIS